MHKCIMVKAGETKTRKVGKKHVNSRKTGRNLQTLGERNKFRNTGNGHQQFWRTKQNFFRKSWKHFLKLKFSKFSEKRGESEIGEKMHNCLRGDGRPWTHDNSPKY